MTNQTVVLIDLFLAFVTMPTLASVAFSVTKRRYHRTTKKYERTIWIIASSLFVFGLLLVIHANKWF